ncbi:hypothetical protein DAQ1742_04235 [Dickeya aquatica]|uniref:Uncharacterized protein n=1 Tax=Dickeya aquatica TaxID=1401087 RepID=A0A375AG07_9GAMM|nr:hypothetical protein DAQ1742_04235 [Dickeya aquatica]
MPFGWGECRRGRGNVHFFSRFIVVIKVWHRCLFHHAPVQEK